MIVIGAGPAGLASSRELSRRGIEHMVLEAGGRVGHCWANAYDSLRLHTGKHLSSLPGLRFGRGVPLFPTRDQFLDYLDRYRTHIDAPVLLNTRVSRIEREGEWRVLAGDQEFCAPALIVATGIMSNPVRPPFSGYEGRLLHSVEYRNPEPFRGGRVLVIGVGNSGGEIASELGHAGVDTTIAVRSGANVVPLTIAGLPTQYLATLVRKLPRAVQEWVVTRIRRRNEKRRPPVLPRARHSPLDAIPLIGFHLVDAISAGRVKLRGGVAALSARGARFLDGSEEEFDAVILATGFRAALQPFHGLVSTDAKGFALRSDRVSSAEHEGLFFVGHNYDASGGLRNIARDAPLAVRALGRYLTQ